MANYLTYDRDINVTGSITSRAINPEYGTSVSFEFLDYTYYTQDNYTKRVQKELNNLLIDYNLKFTQKTEDEAKSLISFLEKVSTGVSGAKTNFNFNENNSDNVAINFPTGNVYKNISGLLIDSYDVQFHNGLFDINLTAKTNAENTFCAWKDSVFLNSGNVKDFISGTNYEKFDIVFVTGTGAFLHKLHDDRKRFFYLQNTGQINSIQEVFNDIAIDSDTTDLRDYTGILTRDFFFEPDDQVSVNYANSSNILKFDTSIQEAQNLSKNKNIIQSLSLNFSNRSDKETFCLLHFLEKHEAPKTFKLSLPKLFKREKFFKIKNFNHTFIYKDCNNIKLNLIEVVDAQKEPNPIIPFHLGTEHLNEGLDQFPILTEDKKRLRLEYNNPLDNIKAPTDLFNTSTFDLLPLTERLPVDLNFKLTWENIGGSDEGFDLDINVIDPSNNLHNYLTMAGNPINPGLLNSSTGREVRGEDVEFVGETVFEENLFWQDQASNGNYQFYAEMFNKNTNHSSCNYVITVLTGNNVPVQSGSGSFTTDSAFDSQGTIFTYNYTKIT